MGGKTRSGTAWKNGYTSYKASSQYEKNRRRDLQTHLKDHPNDEVAQKAVGSIKYRRKKPNAKNGWTFAAFKNESKEFRSTVRTKSESMFWAQARKMEKKSANVMRHAPKTLREAMSKSKREIEAKENAKQANKKVTRR